MIKVTVVLLIGLTAALGIKRASAALRHWVLTVSLVCAVLMPALERAVPTWQLPSRITAIWHSDPIAVVIPLRTDRAHSSSAQLGFTSTAAPLVDPAGIANILWIAGTTIALLLLALGWVGVSRVASRASPVLEGPWKDQCDEWRARLGLGYVELLQSDHRTLLATWGWMRPRVVLPASARDWPMERIRVVLAHELAHIARHDWIIQLGASIFQAIYWFNPVAWLACRALRRQSEIACDDVVLQMGVDAPAYAGQLLDIARDLRSARRWDMTFPAPAMARRSSLEGRVRAMLNTHRSRLPVSRVLGVCAALALVAIILPVAGVMAGSQAATSRFSGTVMDTVGRAMPDLRLVLTSAGDKSTRDASSDDAGRFEFRDLLPGEYVIRIERAGFAPVQGRVALESGQDLEQDIALQIGSVVETVVVTTSASDVPPPPPAAPPPPTVGDGRPAPPPPPSAPPSLREHMRAPRESVCAGNQVGGCLDPPVKLLDVRPQYPARQRQAGVSAKVRLDGRIGSDGFMKDLHVAGPATGDFASAALEAASAWRFAPTRLGGVPVETPIRITFDFQAN